MAPLHDALAALGATVHAGRPRGAPAGHGAAGRSTRVDDVEMPRRHQQPVPHRADADRPVHPRRAARRASPLRSSRVRTCEITAAVMAEFGHDAVTIGERSRRGRRRARTAAADYAIEPDASSASYPLAAAAICGGRVEVTGPDRGVGAGRRRRSATCWPRWAARSRPRRCVDHRRRRRTVCDGIDIDMVDLSDLVPTLAAVAAFAAAPDAHPRRRLHPGQGERPARRSRAPSCVDSELTPPRPTTGWRSCRPTLHGSRRRHPPRPPAGDGVRPDRPACPGYRDRRSRCRVEELAGVLGDARGPADERA